MPFQKGHPGYSSKKIGNRSPLAVRRRVTLARYLHEAISEEEIYEWLRAVAAGKDPDAKEGELQVPPDWTTRKAAMSMILDRRDGRPTEHHIIQQELRAAIGVAAISTTSENLAMMPLEKKNQLRELLREIAAPATRLALAQGEEDDDE